MTTERDYKIPVSISRSFWVFPRFKANWIFSSGLVLALMLEKRRWNLLTGLFPKRFTPTKTEQRDPQRLSRSSPLLTGILWREVVLKRVAMMRRKGWLGNQDFKSGPGRGGRRKTSMSGWGMRLESRGRGGEEMRLNFSSPVPSSFFSLPFLVWSLSLDSLFIQSSIQRQKNAAKKSL